MSAQDPASLDDTVMQARFREIIAEYDIKCIVETGIHHGLSTVILAKMVPTVIAIENNSDCFRHLYQNMAMAKVRNVVPVFGNSPDMLRSLAGMLPYNTLYFLDAHWQSYWPLLDEIKAIRPGTGVIVIHDCKVPGHPELGFDSYDGHDLDYEYVQPALSEWCGVHTIEYNERVEGTQHPRGCLYVFPVGGLKWLTAN